LPLRGINDHRHPQTRPAGLVARCAGAESARNGTKCGITAHTVALHMGKGSGTGPGWATSVPAPDLTRLGLRPTPSRLTGASICAKMGQAGAGGPQQPASRPAVYIPVLVRMIYCRVSTPLLPLLDPFEPLVLYRRQYSNRQRKGAIPKRFLAQPRLLPLKNCATIADVVRIA
jgi:hypothetical protein